MVVTKAQLDALAQVKSVSVSGGATVTTTLTNAAKE